MIPIFRRFLVLAALCFSFGGFTFYASVVVPLGSRVLDATAQGFVTQQVTHYINASAAVTIILMTWDAIASRRYGSWNENRVLAASIAIAATCCLSLVALHGRLDMLLNGNEFVVTDPTRFYQLHQVYLWLSIVQWAAFLAMIAVLARRSVSDRRRVGQ
jgi:hypothetical protein